MDSEPPQPDLLLVVAVLPALVGAAYSVVGTAVSSLSPARQAALCDSLEGGDRHAVQRFLKHPDKARTRWVVFRVAGIAATASMLGAHGVQAGSLGPLVAWAASVLIYTIPSQLLRQVAQSRAERWLPAFLRGAHLFDWIVAPLSDPLYFAGQWLSRSRQREPSATLTETEVEILVNEGELNGSLAHDQSEMIRNVLDFGEVTAEELMVPRTQVDALDATFTLEQALAEVIHSQHSRYPVFCDSVDNIAGILHVKDLFQALAQDAASPDSIVRGGLTGREPEGLKLLDLARKPVAFVPEGQLASTVLRDMRAGRHHMAVVLDEFGGVSGVLTLEDLLEEIVGDIQDEHDLDDQQRILMLSEHTALVDASTPVADINRAIGTDLPDGDYVSLGGLLLEELGTVPAQGSTFELHGLRVVIRESDDRHIARVELSDVPGTPRDPTTRPPASAA